MTLISIGSTVASLGGAFGVVRYQVGSILSTLEDVEARLRALDNRIDKNSTQLDVLTQRQGVISAMLDPSNMERRAREAERLITEVEHLKRQRDSR